MYIKMEALIQTCLKSVHHLKSYSTNLSIDYVCVHLMSEELKYS